VQVAVDVGVAVGVPVAVPVGGIVGEIIGVATAVTVGDAVLTTVGDLVDVGTPVLVAAGVDVLVGRGGGVLVAVDDGVLVAEAFCVAVGLGTAVAVCVAAGALVGGAVEVALGVNGVLSELPQADKAPIINTHAETQPAALRHPKRLLDIQTTHLRERETPSASVWLRTTENLLACFPSKMGIYPIFMIGTDDVYTRERGPPAAPALISRASRFEGIQLVKKEKEP